MRGGGLHNYMAERLAEICETKGFRTYREYPVRPGRHPRFVDLWVECHAFKMAVEVEVTVRRVAEDIQKAVDLSADVLMIVMLTPRAVAEALRVLKQYRVAQASSNLRIVVLPFGVALHRCQQMSVSNVTRTLTSHRARRIRCPKESFDRNEGRSL
jgi:hypothetical protein